MTKERKTKLRIIESGIYQSSAVVESCLPEDDTTGRVRCHQHVLELLSANHAAREVEEKTFTTDAPTESDRSSSSGCVSYHTGEDIPLALVCLRVSLGLGTLLKPAGGIADGYGKRESQPHRLSFPLPCFAFVCGLRSSSSCKCLKPPVFLWLLVHRSTLESIDHFPPYYLHTHTHTLGSAFSRRRQDAPRLSQFRKRCGSLVLSTGVCLPVVVERLARSWRWS